MNYRPIPEGSIEVQTGLWAFFNSFPVGETTYSRYVLYAAEGYCFYNLRQSENFDEEGNLLPANERTYATYALTTCTTAEQINARFVSVPREEGYNVLSVPSGEHEVITVLN